MEIKKFNFRNLKTFTNPEANGITLGEYIKAAQLEDLGTNEASDENKSLNSNDSLSKDDIQKLCDEAYERGRIEGFNFIENEIKEKEFQLQQENNLMLEKIESSLKNLLSNDSKKVLELNLKHIQKLSISVAKKLASQALDQNFIHLIEGLISKYVTDLRGNKKIILKIHPNFSSLSEELKSRFSSMLDVDFQVMLEYNLGTYDVEVELSDGLIQRSFDQIANNIQDLLSK